jgi:hypothetical protein
MGPLESREELVADVARSGGYVAHTRGVAERVGAGDQVVAELADMAERLGALHLVALVAGGWCAGESCGAELSDPGASPSGARHCRSCRVGWTLVEDGGRVRAVARPWPASANASPPAPLESPKLTDVSDQAGEMASRGAVPGPTPRRRGLGLGGRLEVRRDQARLREAIADQIHPAPDGRHARTPSADQAPALPEPRLGIEPPANPAAGIDDEVLE